MVRNGLRGIALLLLTSAGFAQPAVQRASRQHSTDTPPEYKALVTRVQPGGAGAREPIASRHSAEDLDQLEWLVENRYAYLGLRPVDHRAALDAIRANLGREIARGDLAIQIQMVLARFGDGHVGVDSSDLERALGGEFAPLLAIDTSQGLIAIKPDRTGFLDDARPILKSIDGVTIDRWIEAAARLAPDGSPQLKRGRTLRFLRFTGYLRKTLGIQPSRSARIELASLRDATTATVDLDLVRDKPLFGTWPRAKTRRLDSNLGYIRLERMNDDARAVQELKSAFDSFKDSRGIILDVRGNGGGKRALIRMLHAFVVGQTALPAVYNLARYRIDPNSRDAPADGFLADRFLFPADWRGWSPRERGIVRTLRADFKASWEPSASNYSDWHYLILPMPEQPVQEPYGRPIVVLMDGDCFSATDVLLSVLKGLPGVTLLGTASGGGSGRPEPFKLAHSKIDVQLSSMASYLPDGSLLDTLGVKPDILVEAVATDLIGRTDTQLDAARKRLESK